MLTAISRYGVRMPPATERIVEGCYRRGQLVEGPDIAAFEREFAASLGGGAAVGTSYGRMAFYLMLKALDLPRDSEIVFPALTFWVIPELARVAGLRPVFVDIDPNTFTLDPVAFERAIGPRTRAVVPTHLFGLPCDMDPIMTLARRHKLAVIEDCAHALGATYKGQPVGTFGDGALFSFQTIKPLNAFGGGVALLSDRRLGARVATLASAQRWPAPGRVAKRLLAGWFHRLFTRPGTFTFSQFPILWTASWFDANPDVYFWENIRPLDRFPDDYSERFANVHAALALAGLEKLDEWTAQTQAHARQMNDLLGGLRGVQTPAAPRDRQHVYYQYCVYTPWRDEIVKRCIRRGIDLETLHVDVCSSLPLFNAFRADTPDAERTAHLIQAPIHASLTDAEVVRVGRTIRDAVLEITREVEQRQMPAERSA
jgi:dTDP-4-amino-4,6-dideoxygalactose transaminase